LSIAEWKSSWCVKGSMEGASEASHKRTPGRVNTLAGQG
jgi:hypothetical protein